MHRQFLRLFLSIVSITVLVLFLQLAFFLIFNRFMENSWKETIFDEFAASIDNTVTSIDLESGNNIGSLIVGASSERISGIVFRDKSGRIALAMGVSPKGLPVPQVMENYNSESVSAIKNLKLKVSSEVDNLNVHDIKIDRPKYRLSLDFTVYPNGIKGPINSIAFESIDLSGKESVSYPDKINSKDVAGTIEIAVNGEVESYLDVLVFSLDYYNPTRYIINSLLNGFVVTLFVGILIALVGAYIISRKNGRYVKSILSSLESLSKGEHDVKRIKTRISDYWRISNAIIELDKNLKRHSELRKEWIRSISHDLNTPVASMNILIECAKDGIYPLDMALIEKIKNENDALKERIASIAFYSYLLSPDTKAKSERISLINEIDSAIMAVAGKYTLSVDPDIYIQGDSELILRALEEVMKNAVSYSKGSDEIRLYAERYGDFIVLRVVNGGTLPLPMPNFFEPWAKGDESRNSSGSGMGLSIVYQIMIMNGGRVSISQAGENVVLALYLVESK